jgi:hypothetical protein
MLFGWRINKVVDIGSVTGRIASMQSVIVDASQEDLTSLASAAGLMLYLAMVMPWKGIVRVRFGCSREVPEKAPPPTTIQKRGPKME